jgi:uncharacterized protein YjdB
MKRSTIAFALIVSLLFIAAVSFNGCGKSNTITSITVMPSDPQFIAKDTTKQLFVTAHFTDGKFLLFWTQVTWQSSDNTVATVSTTGLVKALKEGTAVITAVDIAHPSITNSITVSVTDLTIAPAVAIISVGTSTQFTATAAFSSAPTITPKNITELVSWASFSTAIAEVSNSTGSQGLVTAVSAGTTTITATFLATGLTGTPATLTVVP